jgi:hypothetical protein
MIEASMRRTGNYVLAVAISAALLIGVGLALPKFERSAHASPDEAKSVTDLKADESSNVAAPDSEASILSPDTRTVFDGETRYVVAENSDGAILRSRSETLYLGNKCDAYSPKHGRGRWEWANGGFLVTFNDATEFGFPRQDPPNTGGDCHS